MKFPCVSAGNSKSLVLIKSHALLKSSSSIINNDKFVFPEVCVDLSYVPHLTHEIILDRH